MPSKMSVDESDVCRLDETTVVFKRGPIQRAEVASSLLEKNSENAEDKFKRTRLKDKEFIPRNSLLTDLLEVDHCRAIQHVIIAAITSLFIEEVVEDSFKYGTRNGKVNAQSIVGQLTHHNNGVAKQRSLKLTWRPKEFAQGFAQFDKMIFIWMLQISTTTIVVYFGFRLWALRAFEGLWNVVWLVLYIAYFCLFIYIPLRLTKEYQLGPAAACAITAEQVRQLMKTHAFLRSNCSRVLISNRMRDQAPQPGNSSQEVPKFSNYVYFLFAPTLIYRDQYPRNSHIRWKFVASNFGQFFGTIFLMYIVVTRMLVPTFSEMGKEYCSPTCIVVALLHGIIPSIFIMLVVFFGFMHSFLNAFAEILKFADRQFYQDWWNSNSFPEFYKKWNIFMHDWLYNYVYKDVYQVTSSRTWAVTAVFFLSMLGHEYIITQSTKIFLPSLYISLFVCTVISTLLSSKKKSRRRNVALWFGLLWVFSTMATSLTVEWFADINCPTSYQGSFLGRLTPRVISCHQ